MEESRFPEPDYAVLPSSEFLRNFHRGASGKARTAERLSGSSSSRCTRRREWPGWWTPRSSAATGKAHQLINIKYTLIFNILKLIFLFPRIGRRRRQVFWHVEYRRRQVEPVAWRRRASQVGVVRRQIKSNASSRRRLRNILRWRRSWCSWRSCLRCLSLRSWRGCRWSCWVLRCPSRSRLPPSLLFVRAACFVKYKSTEDYSQPMVPLKTKSWVGIRWFCRTAKVFRAAIACILASKTTSGGVGQFSKAAKLVLATIMFFVCDR